MTPAGNRNSDGPSVTVLETRLGRGRSLCGLISLFLLVAWLFTWVSACGDEDLIFPGDIPIPTAKPEATETPDEEEE
jgi:hypothetical protein